MISPAADPIDILATGTQPPLDEGDMCVVCQEPLLGMQVHKLECGHMYHPACIVSWFRSGQDKCPYCGDRGIVPTTGRKNRWGTPNLASMVSYARRKDAPESLVRMVDSLRAAEELLASRKKLYMDFEKNEPTNISFSRAAMEYRRLKSSYWRQYKSVTLIKRRIDDYPIVRLVIPKFVPVPNQTYGS